MDGKRMNVVGVIGSPHAEGNGAKLVREALKGAAEAGAEVREVFLPGYRIEYCRDCRACMSTGRCVVDDDFQEVRGLLCAADGIVLGSPTYGAEMCARMKNLFDRLGQFAFLTSTFGGKYVAGLATAGSFGAARTAGHLAAGFRDSVFRRAYVSGTLGVRLRGRQVGELPRALGQARSLGRRLASDIRRGRRFPLQNLAGRLPNALLLRPMIRRAIVEHREAMPGVYDQLVRSGIVEERA